MIGQTFSNYVICVQEKLNCKVFNLKSCTKLYQVKNGYMTKKVINSPSCEMCKEEKVDDMTHHFIECSGLNNFWNVFENWWNRTATYPIELSNKLIMFGIYYDNTFYKNVNYVILLANGTYIDRCT